jgi:hypothetical protein
MQIKEQRTVKQIRRESRERNYAELKPYVFDKVHMFFHNIRPHCQGQSFSPE